MKMGENVQIVLDFQTIKKTFLNYDIELTCERNSLNIAIINKIIQLFMNHILMKIF